MAFWFEIFLSPPVPLLIALLNVGAKERKIDYICIKVGGKTSFKDITQCLIVLNDKYYRKFGKIS